MASPVRADSARRPSTRATRHTPVVAPITRRIIGAAIDMALLVFASGTVAAMLEGVTAGVTRVRVDAVTGQRTVDATISLPTWLPLAILVILTAAYTVPLMALWGRTLGGWAVGIRCVRADTGGSPGWDLSTRRWLALYGVAGLLAFVPVVGPFAWALTLVIGLSPLWDPTHRMRGYADHIGDDIVILTRQAAARS